MPNFSKLRPYLPLLYFLLLVFLIWMNLGKDPSQLPSALVNKPVPHFNLPSLHDPQNRLTEQELKGQVSLLHVFASWCGACAHEQDFLVHITKAHKLNIIGLNYKDSVLEAKAWLKKYGDPFTFTVIDDTGKLAIDLGVYGTPETFVIDKQGIIRHRHVGPLGPSAWKDEIYPLMMVLNNETI